MSTPITISAIVNAPIEKVWACWTEPEHITQWCHASDDWHAPSAENDLKVGGTFTTVMAAKDGSFSFDFGGTYTEVERHAVIAYGMSDGRIVRVEFSSEPEGVRVVETFGPESENSPEMQRQGWQAILDNFKKHVEAHA